MSSMASPRSILHVDMDAFFAAVEQLDNPALRGKAILIGSDRPRSVVTTASYEARPYDCRSAQPMAQARRLCPHALVIPPRFWRYREISDRMFAILESFTPLVQPVSIDEAFLDVTGSERLFGSAEDIARRIRRRVKEELNLTVSVGVAPNRFLAKLASDMNKPDGLTVVPSDNLTAWLAPLPISRIWGVGPRTVARLGQFGIRTVRDLQKLGPEELRRHFGNDADHYRRLAIGLDDRPVTPDSQAKSIGQEQTFETDLLDLDDLRDILLGQVEQVARRLRRYGLQARTITLKIRDGQFNTITRSNTLENATDSTKAMWDCTRAILEAWAGRQFRPVRLLGMSATQFSRGEGQLPLFIAEDQQKQRKLDRALDSITTKFGAASIHRGARKER